MNETTVSLKPVRSSKDCYVGEIITMAFIALTVLIVSYAVHILHHDVPRMRGLLEDMGAALPGLLKVLILVSSFVTTWWCLIWPVLWLLLLVTVYVAWRVDWRIAMAVAVLFISLGGAYAMLAGHYQARLLWFGVSQGHMEL